MLNINIILKQLKIKLRKRLFIHINNLINKSFKKVHPNLIIFKEESQYIIKDVKHHEELEKNLEKIA